MTCSFIVLCFGAMLAMAGVTQAPSSVQSSAGLTPPVPFEDIGACPFEGCVYREWIASRPVVVRRDRRTNAPIAFRVKPGEKVTALSGVVITVKAGRVEFREPHDVSTSEGPIHIVPGQTLYLLTYQGEGYTKAWFNGRVYQEVDVATFLNAVCDVGPSRCPGRVVEPSQTVWWVRVRNATGAVGWTHEPDKFDGKDALGQ